MKNNLLEIFNHYGEDNQRKKLKEELEELLFELDHPAMSNREYFVDELADVLVMCLQFAFTYPEVKQRMLFKIDRQLKRMRENKS